MLAAIRLRGEIKTDMYTERTCQLLGLKHNNTLVLLQDTPSVRGMLRHAESNITWGEASEELAKLAGKSRSVRLKPPPKGFRSIKTSWPVGDLGYRGDKINELAKKMM